MNTKDPSFAEAYGCHKPKPGIENVVNGCEFELDRCPMHYLTRPDDWRDRILGLFEDYESGNIHSWPESYTAPTVEAIRLLHRHVRAYQADAIGG